MSKSLEGRSCFASWVAPLHVALKADYQLGEGGSADCASVCNQRASDKGAIRSDQWHTTGSSWVALDCRRPVEGLVTQ